MEYLKYRCCMCPNSGKDEIICPGIEGTTHPKSSKCRFVKSYIDEDGWIYKVVHLSLREHNFVMEDLYKARYRKVEKIIQKCGTQKSCSSNGYPKLSYTNLEWRTSFDKAQTDLNELAEIHAWEEYENE